MAKRYPTVAACDFGSGKITVLLSEVTPQGLEVIGFGQSSSQGVRKGVIVNIDSTVRSLSEAMGEARSYSNAPIDYLVAGVTGPHIQVTGSSGMVPVRDQEVKAFDIEKVIEAASAINTPLDREVIQILPREFIIDGQDGIKEPLGMYGKRLEVQIQMITGSVTALQNVRRCLSKAGVDSNHIVSSPFASARAVTSEEEKEAGVCVVDIGASTTDMAVFQEGVLSFIRSLPVGGMHLTNDLAVGLKTSIREAEELKKQYGCQTSLTNSETIEISSLSGADRRTVSRRLLSAILRPRMEEIFGLIRNELAKEGLDEALPSGVVITGGCSHLKGILQVGEKVFKLPIRLGKPAGLGGLSDMVSTPAYATVVGLMQIGFEESSELMFTANLYQKKGWMRAQSQLIRWVKDFF